MKNPEKIPERLAKGITYLLPKTSGTNNPKRQIIYLYHIRMHTSIPETKIIATAQTDKKYITNDTVVKTGYLSTELLLKIATRKNEILSQHVYIIPTSLIVFLTL